MVWGGAFFILFNVAVWKKLQTMAYKWTLFIYTENFIIICDKGPNFIIFKC